MNCSIISLFFFVIICTSIISGPDIIDKLLLPSSPLPDHSSAQPQLWGPYKDEDCSIDGSVSKPYKLHVEDDVLDDLHDRLQKWKQPGAPIQHADKWSYGIDSVYTSKLVSYWKNNYDWRKHEKQLNTLGLSEIVVDGLLIRMHHIQRGKGDKAILLLHGWPGSIHEFNRFIGMMQQQKDLDEFSIVCPSLPGYGFSSAPTREGYNVVAMAGTMTRLMDKLGYNQYIIQGGDWGSAVAQSIEYLNPPSLVGLHLNFFPVGPSPGHFILDEFKIRIFDDKDSQQRAKKAKDLSSVLIHTGYFHQQATKPETLGYALSDSPVGLCSWITEKFHSWSDSSLPLEEKFEMDDLLTNCMIYWVTNSITSSMRL